MLPVPRTWEDLLSVSQALTNEGIGRVGMGFENSFDMEWTAILYQLGGNFINETTNEAVFASPAGFQALQLIFDFVNGPYGRTAGADGFMSGVFGRQDVAMYIGSSAGLPHVEAAVAETFNWGVIPTPGTGDSRAVQFAGNDIVMFALNSSHTEAERRGAWEFLRFTMDPLQSAMWAAISGYIPVRYESLTHSFWLDHLENDPRHGAAPEQFDEGFFLTRVPEANQVRSELLIELENAILEIHSVEEALTRAQNAANDILSGR
jgi:multiple sugar transport system substrate-binding protein